MYTPGGATLIPNTIDLILKENKLRRTNLDTISSQHSARWRHQLHHYPPGGATPPSPPSSLLPAPSLDLPTLYYSLYRAINHPGIHQGATPKKIKTHEFRYY
jgi:hypothetical protein